MAASPFQPGQRVAVEVQLGGFRSLVGYREDLVDKLYRNGNFTLKSAPGDQWRPQFESDGNRGARRTGDGFHRQRLVLWDSVYDAKIKAGILRAELSQRWRDASLVIEKADHRTVSEEAVVHLEAAAALVKPPEAKS